MVREMKKRTIVKEILRGRCLSDYNGDLSRWKRWYYTVKAVLCVTLGREESDDRELFSESCCDPIVVAGFNLSEFHGLDGTTKSWDQLEVYRDFFYYNLEGNSCP